VITVGGPQYRAVSHRQFVLLARALAAGGYPVLRYDYRGLGDSDGAPRTFESIDEDIDAAARTLRDETKVNRVVLWGLCDAATAALMRGNVDPGACGIVALNPWVRAPATHASTMLRHYYLRRLADPAFWHKLARGGLKLGSSIRDLGGSVRAARTGGDGPDFLARMQRGWSSFERPILFVLSGQDLTAREFEEWVAGDSSRACMMKGRNVTTVRFDDADHTFSRREWREAVARATLDFLSTLHASEGDERSRRGPPSARG
jgi:exosortase A-associated hydrolase 1